jgi:hypothetical protein
LDLERVPHAVDPRRISEPPAADPSEEYSPAVRGQATHCLEEGRHAVVGNAISIDQDPTGIREINNRRMRQAPVWLLRRREIAWGGSAGVAARA